jgi:DNA-binding NarL/FixJ family response regulator
MDNTSTHDTSGTPDTETLRVLLADDHALFRRGLRALLGTSPGIIVIGEAESGEEAMALAGTLRPDVILMDIQMPGINGIDATRRILQAHPDIRILIVTIFEDDPSVFTAMRAGARGYILKDAKKVDIISAVQAVGRGEAIFSPTIAARLIEFFAAMAPSQKPQAQVFPELTEREREILNLIAGGHNNAEIASKLVLGQNTVRNYVSSIFSKLQVADRAQAIVRAREAGLGQ